MDDLHTYTVLIDRMRRKVLRSFALDFLAGIATAICFIGLIVIVVFGVGAGTPCPRANARCWALPWAASSSG